MSKVHASAFTICIMIFRNSLCTRHWTENKFAPARLTEHMAQCKTPQKIRAPNSTLDRRLRLANAYKSGGMTREEFLQTVRRSAHTMSFTRSTSLPTQPNKSAGL